MALFRVRKTICTMLRKRGYLVAQKDLDMTMGEFNEEFGAAPQRSALTHLVQKLENDEDKLFVFFPEDENVGVKPIRQYVVRMKEMGVFRAIIVVQTKMTPFAKQALNEMRPKYVLEFFLESELMIDITEHTLVPDHEVLTPIQKQQLLARYKLKETQLPRIQPRDPVARFYGLTRGQVVKIIRPSETAGRYVTYRIVL